MSKSKVRKKKKSSTTTKTDEYSSREFEKLVSRIEKVYSSSDTIVTSPDKIKDKITGSMREVDASIRIKQGTSELLITIECRKRTPIQDTTWIEQLVKSVMILVLQKQLLLLPVDLLNLPLKKQNFMKLI